MEYKKSKLPHKFSHQNFHEIKGVRGEGEGQLFNRFPLNFHSVFKAYRDTLKNKGGC